MEAFLGFLIIVPIASIIYGLVKKMRFFVYLGIIIIAFYFFIFIASALITWSM